MQSVSDAMKGRGLDVRDAADLTDLLRMGRLPEAYRAPSAVQELCELVRHRAKCVALRSGLKAEVHAVLATQGVHLPVSDIFGVKGRALLVTAPLDPVFRARLDGPTPSRMTRCSGVRLTIGRHLNSPTRGWFTGEWNLPGSSH